MWHTNACTRALRVLRLISMVDSRTERLCVLLSGLPCSHVPYSAVVAMLPFSTNSCVLGAKIYFDCSFKIVLTAAEAFIPLLF